MLESLTTRLKIDQATAVRARLFWVTQMATMNLVMRRIKPWRIIYAWTDIRRLKFDQAKRIRASMFWVTWTSSSMTCNTVAIWDTCPLKSSTAWTRHAWCWNAKKHINPTATCMLFQHGWMRAQMKAVDWRQRWAMLSSRWLLVMYFVFLIDMNMKRMKVKRVKNKK